MALTERERHLDAFAKYLYGSFEEWANYWSSGAWREDKLTPDDMAHELEIAMYHLARLRAENKRFHEGLEEIWEGCCEKNHPRECCDCPEQRARLALIDPNL